MTKTIAPVAGEDLYQLRALHYHWQSLVSQAQEAEAEMHRFITHLGSDRGLQGVINVNLTTGQLICSPEKKGRKNGNN